MVTTELTRRHRQGTGVLTELKKNIRKVYVLVLVLKLFFLFLVYYKHTQHFPFPQRNLLNDLSGTSIDISLCIFSLHGFIFKSPFSTHYTCLFLGKSFKLKVKYFLVLIIIIRTLMTEQLHCGYGTMICF